MRVVRFILCVLVLRKVFFSKGDDLELFVSVWREAGRIGALEVGKRFF